MEKIKKIYSASALSRSLNNCDQHTSGYFTPSSLHKLLLAVTQSLKERKKIWSDQHFVDCGVGENLPGWVAGYVFLCQKVTGIDSNQWLIHQNQAFLKKHPCLTTAYSFRVGDLLAETSFYPFSVLYMNNLAFHPQVTLHILKLICNSPSIHTVVMSVRALQKALSYLKTKKRNSFYSYWQELQPFSKHVCLLGGSHCSITMGVYVLS